MQMVTAAAIGPGASSSVPYGHCLVVQRVEVHATLSSDVSEQDQTRL